jgi:serine/alanine adding enzyme
LILIRSLPLGIKLFYVPKGYVIDFENQELVIVFTKEIIKEVKEKSGYVLKLDPNFCVTEESIETMLGEQVR